MFGFLGLRFALRFLPDGWQSVQKRAGSTFSRSAARTCSTMGPARLDAGAQLRLRGLDDSRGGDFVRPNVRANATPAEWRLGRVADDRQRRPHGPGAMPLGVAC